MKPRLHPSAAAEVEQTAGYYERCEPGLGHEFVEQVGRDIALLLETGAAWPPWPGLPPGLGVRRFLLHRFPYAIAYRVEGDHLTVYAVAAHRRRPGYWVSRVP